MVRMFAVAVSVLLCTGLLIAQEKTKEEVRKNASPEKKQAREAARKEGARSDGGGQKGRLAKIAVESGVVKLSVDGKEYEFTTTDNTFAVLRTVERDGKQVVVAVQLVNGEGAKGGGEKRAEKTEAVKKEQLKSADDKPAEKKPN